MKTPNHIDRHVGGRLRQLREARGLALQDLAHMTGVPAPHLIALEQGRERISAELMRKLSRILRVRPSDYFTGLAQGATQNGKDADAEMTAAEQEQKLRADFARIRDAKCRATILALVAAYAEFGDLEAG
jgi:transcriptional regulator with XRE-family HTH domain